MSAYLSKCFVLGVFVTCFSTSANLSGVVWFQSPRPWLRHTSADINMLLVDDKMGMLACMLELKTRLVYAARQVWEIINGKTAMFKAFLSSKKPYRGYFMSTVGL